MKVVAQKKPAENHKRLSNIASPHSAKQPTSSSLFLNNDILIQHKPICPCDGGCPRCTPVIQPKLTIGQPNDKYEQEADRVAEQLMSTTVDSRQKAVGSTVNTIQKQDEEETIQPKPT